MRERVSGVQLQVLSALPGPLAVIVLRAALANMPPSIKRLTLSVSPVPFEEQRAMRMHAVMAALPGALQPLVLRAHDPAVDGAASLTLRHAGAPTAAAVARVAAAGLGTPLTALSLRASLKHPHMRERLGDGACFTHDDIRGAIGAVSEPLRHLQSLESLEFCVVNLCRPVLCVHTLAEVLPALTRLTHLDVGGSTVGGPGLRGLAQSLPALRMLRSLDLGRGGAEGAGNQQDHAPLQALSGALRTLCALTSLSLAHNMLEGWRWEALAPGVAALPLRRLRLDMCGLRDGFDLFSGADGPRGSAFAELEDIDVSKNNFTLVAPELAGRLPRLTRLVMTRVPLSVGAEEQVLRDLLGNAAVKLEDLQLGQCNGAPGTVRMLCDALTRWTALRTVSLSWRRGEAAAALPEVAPCCAALPQLQELWLGYASMLVDAAVPEALGALTGLTSLRLLWMQCGVGGARALAGHLGALTRLCVLVVWCTAGECEAGSGEELASGMHALTALTHLSLDTVALGDAGTERLAEALACMSGMRELRLPRNMIAPAGATALAASLHATPALSVLELTRNRLGDLGAAALRGVLPRMARLRQLGLGGCDVSEDGKTAILRAVPGSVQSIVV